MESRALGASGVIVPALGLGTVKIGRNRDVKYPDAFDLPDDRSVDALLEAALDEGVVLWDTAAAYGSSEERLGRRLPAVRDRVIVSTKAGEEYDDDGSRHDFSARAITRSVERSLRRLRTDHVDICLLHSDGNDGAVLARDETIDALRQLREAGKARAIGISAKTPEGIELAARELDVVMAPFGRGNEALRDALRGARRAGCGVLAIKALGQGHLVQGDQRAALRDALEFVLLEESVDAVVFGTCSAHHLRETAELAREILDRGEGRRT